MHGREGDRGWKVRSIGSSIHSIIEKFIQIYFIWTHTSTCAERAGRGLTSRFLNGPQEPRHSPYPSPQPRVPCLLERERERDGRAELAAGAHARHGTHERERKHGRTRGNVRRLCFGMARGARGEARQPWVCSSPGTGGGDLSASAALAIPTRRAQAGRQRAERQRPEPWAGLAPTGH